MPELQTPEVEQLVHETMSNLKKLETLFVWDFEQAVSDIAWLATCHVEKEEETPNLLDRDSDGIWAGGMN